MMRGGVEMGKGEGSTVRGLGRQTDVAPTRKLSHVILA